MTTLTLAEAHTLVADALVRCGTLPPAARSVARALVGAEADGLKGHGLSRVASYAAQVRAGKVVGDAAVATTRAGLLEDGGRLLVGNATSERRRECETGGSEEEAATRWHGQKGTSRMFRWGDVVATRCGRCRGHTRNPPGVRFRPGMTPI